MRNKVYMNEVKPEDRIERDLSDRLDRMAGVRPLDGTNLEWIYQRVSLPSGSDIAVMDTIILIGEKPCLSRPDNY